MTKSLTRCLILACGNSLRSDDGVGPWLAAWAEKQFHANGGVRVLSRQQWTLELAEEIAAARSVLFIDCSTASSAGAIKIIQVHPAAIGQGQATHHQGAPELLALARDLYSSLPRNALLMIVGADSTELGEEFSAAVTAALPEACRMLDETVARLLASA